MIIWELWIQTSAAMAPYLMSSIVGIKGTSFIITTGTAKIRAAINNNGPG
jgi:hypothetical protein